MGSIGCALAAISKRAKGDYDRDLHAAMDDCSKVHTAFCDVPGAAACVQVKCTFIRSP